MTLPLVEIVGICVCKDEDDKIGKLNRITNGKAKCFRFLMCAILVGN